MLKPLNKQRNTVRWSSLVNHRPARLHHKMHFVQVIFGHVTLIVTLTF